MAVMLLEWVFTSIFLILVVLALRAALGKRVSAGLRYALWAVVLVRLLVPVQLFTSPLAGTWVVSEADTERNVYTVPAPSANMAEPVISLPETGVTPGAVPNFPDAPTMPDAPEPPAAPDLTRAPAWLGWIWLAGSAAVALVLLVSNLRFYWRLRRERVLLEGADCHLRVYAAVNLPSPCLLGIARPAIYVTPEAAADPDMLRHVLAHEHTHYRHGDHVWSLLRCAALVVHWWNPLVWVSAVLSQRDAELACDEGALKRLGDGERAGYGGTLLALVTAKPRPADLFRCATTMAGDKKSLKERITRIAQAPRRVLWAVVVAVAVTALACVCAFGQAEPAEPEEDVNGKTELSFSINDHGLVDITGTVLGMTLEPGTYWQPTGAPAGTISMRYTPFSSDGIKGFLTAWWETPTSVSITTSSMSALSSSAFAGYWNFTVELSGETGVVTQMSANGSAPEGTEMKLYPESISDEEAIRAARIAAKLMTEAEEYYSSQSSKDSADLSAHFVADVSGVPAQVLDTVGQDVRGKYEQYLQELTEMEKAGQQPAKGWPEFDGWRVVTLDGPWSRTILGMDVEIWRVFREYHTPEPEKAEFMLAGGMYVTAGGWFTPADWRDYYIFSLDQTGRRSLAAIMPMGAGGGAPDGETQWQRDDFDAMVERALADTRAVDPSGLTSDLNRNGVPEELRVVSIDGGAGQKLEVWEEGKLLYSEEGYFAHAGYNALFLYHDDDGDYLLRYNPYMAQGWCTYSYRLFTLNEHGASTARYVDLNFDLNFEPMMQESHQFDVNEIVRFMNEINELLWHSVQLINTDEDLLDTFEKNGRLYDDLGWLGWWEPIYVRGGQALPDELWRFKMAMEEQWHAEEPKVFRMNEGEVKGNDAHVLLRYQDRSTQFDARWESEFQPEEAVNAQVLDLNRDGKDEIVFSLVEGEGTGCLVENLYVFDAETLEQYGTDRLNEMIFNSIESTGDEENFYLRGAGMDETIPKSEAQAKNPYAPMADTLWFEDYIRYTIEDGQVFCWLGCDASGSLINYTGYIKVPINMSPSGAFTCGTAMYVDIKDDGQAMS